MADVIYQPTLPGIPILLRVCPISQGLWLVGNLPKPELTMKKKYCFTHNVKLYSWGGARQLPTYYYYYYYYYPPTTATSTNNILYTWGGRTLSTTTTTHLLLLLVPIIYYIPGGDGRYLLLLLPTYYCY